MYGVTFKGIEPKNMRASKNLYDGKVFKGILFIAITNCQVLLYCLVGLIPLWGKNCSDHAKKTEFWYLLGFFFKISDDQHRHFCMVVPQGRGKEGSAEVLTAMHRRSNVPSYVSSGCRAFKL